MRVWSITVGEPIPGFSQGDRLWRCGFLSQLLASRGHDVTWWTSSIDHFSKKSFVKYEQDVSVAPGLSVQFLKGCSYKKNVSLARFINHIQIARAFKRIAARRPRPDLIVCSYPTIELCDAAVQFGQIHRVPVFLDVRDLWPDEIILHSPKVLRPLVQLALWPKFRQAKRAFHGAHGVIGISETYLAWGLRTAGRDATASDRVVPLGYTGALKLPESLDSARDNVHTLGVNPAKRIFWFSGTFVGNIDLGTVIEAARLLVDNESLQFLLTGAGERDELWRKQAAGLPNVIFSGWADQHELARLAAVAWVGLGAYKKNASMSLPNKIFEYMSAELPVLISLGGETKELVTSNEIGLWFRPGDALDLSEKVQLLASDEELRNRLAKNAGVLFESQYSPSNLYDKYADFLEANAADSNSLN